MAKQKKLPNNLLGGRFKNLCFVGLNRSEVHLASQPEPLFGEGWQDITDDQSRKKMAMCFFAPQEIATEEEQDPYLYLAADPGHTPEEENEARTVTKQALGDTPLLDFCKLKEDKPNVVNFVIASDVLFHYDSDGAYIQPTNQQTWVRDLKGLIKNYPRGAKISIYTDWEHDQFGELNQAKQSIRELPLNTEIWLNMPSFYEKWGMMVLMAGIIIGGLVFGAMQLQQQQISGFNSQIRQLESNMPRVSNLSSLRQLLSHQERHMRWREEMPFVIRDIGFAIQHAGMQTEQFEIKVHDLNENYDYLLTTIEARRNVYQGWLQEEPVAKGVLTHSSTLTAVRKPPRGGVFELEGLIDLRKVEEQLEAVRAATEAETVEDAAS